MMTWDELCKNQIKRDVYPKGLLFDIGANSGDYSNYALSCGAEEIVVVEANPNLIEILQNRFHNHSNIHIINRAVSDKPDDIVKFYISNAHTISTLDRRWIENSRFSEEYMWNDGIDIMTTTIDQLIEYHGYPKQIKIDVEGYEYPVIMGLSDRYDCEELSFEWAEETNGDILNSIKYLEKIGFEKFGYTYGEGEPGVFDLYPSEFKSCSEIINDFEKVLDPNRKVYWGMVFAI
jgi:FkbM family methyltransferase